MFNIIIVGHFSIDSIFLPSRETPFTVLGGSAAYVSLAARRLDSKVAVISKVGHDFPEAYKWWLQQEGIDISAVTKTEEDKTTHFELKYNKDLTNRTLRLANRAKPITIEDLPNPLKTDAIHIAPIAEEITYEVIKELRKHANILSLDPQGLLRNFDENGNITPKPLTDKHILEQIDIYKSSQQEIQVATGIPETEQAIKAVHEHGAKIVIATLGSQGAIVSVENTIHKVPAYQPEKLVDPTGAGDAFIGVFLAEYIKGEDSSWSSCAGSAAASLVVEGIGPTFFGDKEQIYKRAKTLYEKEK